MQNNGRKRSLGLCLLALLLAALWAQAQCLAQDEEFTYIEGFEEKDPVVSWVSNGEYEVNFKGLTDEKAFSGKRSFKLDVTLKSGSYHYWSVPIRVQAVGELRFSGRILVETPTNARVGLGANFVFPPTHHSGCGAIDTFDKPTGEWKLQEWDLVSRGSDTAKGVMSRYVWGVKGEDVGCYLDRWGIFIYGGAGKRVVVYIDDVRIEGKVTPAENYDQEVQKRWAPVRDAFLKKMDAWQEELDRMPKDMAGLKGLPPGAKRMMDAASESFEKAEAEIERLKKRGYAAPGEYGELEQWMEFLPITFQNLQRLQSGRGALRYCATYVTPAITNAKMLPRTFPIPARLSEDIHIAACPGEYEPATFAVYAFDEITDLKLSVTELKSKAAALPPEIVDIRCVKCWYQAGRQVWDTKGKLLTPELLLKDDGLVRVDYEKRENYLRTEDEAGKTTYVLISGKSSENLKDIQPKDADTLQPVDIPAGTLKQFWITVHIPDDAVPGDYTGKIVLQPKNAPKTELTLRLKVLPFKLEKPLLRYSIYYRGKLTSDGRFTISSEGKSPEQYLAEMRDFKAHGVEYPTSYQGFDPQLLTRVFELRAEAGLSKGTLYSLGIGTGSPQNAEQLESLRANVAKWLDLAKASGYDEVYCYGIDEATGERLKAQRAAWAAVHEAGGKVFVACYKRTFEAMGDLLDLAVFAGRPDKAEAEKYHGLGRQIFSYANPQVGNEAPETYRRNYGLALWKSGFDGAMDYAYQHSFHHIWNDFDDPRYRDHVFAYPTVNGVIDTIQWEGFREGVDDCRYLATLLKAIEEAKAQRGKRALAEKAQAWVDDMDVNGNLDSLRKEIIGWIVKLQ